MIERGGKQAPLENEIIIGELGGKCKVEYTKKLCNIGDDFTGVLFMDPSIVEKINSAHLVFYKIEFGDGDENEVNLIETVLFGNPFREYFSEVKVGCIAYSFQSCGRRNPGEFRQKGGGMWNCLIKSYPSAYNT